MKFQVGDRIKFLEDIKDLNNLRYRWITDNIPSAYIKHGSTIIREDEYITDGCEIMYIVGSGVYVIKIPTMTDEGGSNHIKGYTQLGFKEELLVLFKRKFMKRVVDKGSLVKVISKPEVYFDMDETVKELGGTDKWNGKFTPTIGMTGEVTGSKEGYVLVDFPTGMCLLDESCLEPQKRKEEVKILVRFPNNTLEEFSTEEEVKKRVQDLYKAGSVDKNAQIKVYDIAKYREIGLKIDISFI